MAVRVPLVSCPEHEIAFLASRRCFTPMAPPSRDVDREKDKTDVPLPGPNNTGVTEHITRLALEALVRFQLEEQRKFFLLDNDMYRDFDDGVEVAKGEYFDDQGDEHQAEDQTEDDEDEYWGSDRTGEEWEDRESVFFQGLVVASADNEHSDDVDSTYLGTVENDSGYMADSETRAAAGDTDWDHDEEDPDVSFSAVQIIPFAERYYGVAGHQPKDSNNDWSSSDYYSSDCSEDEDSEFGSQGYSEDGDIRKKGNRTLFTQYRLILPPNLFDCDPPIQFSTQPIFYLNPIDIPQGIYAFVKDIVVDSSLCQLVMARSMMQQVNGYGLKKGELCCMKIYSKNHDTAERTRRSSNHLMTEIKAYQRLAEAARRDKPGFLFLMQLDASLQDESRYYLIMPLMKTDLRTVLQNNGLPRANFARELEIRRLLAQIAVGIATLHSMGVIHRDIKPENTLIDFHGNIQIADFGLSMVADSCEPCVSGRKYCWDQVGTWPYIAPELALAEKPRYGLEVDYWALGCIAFEMEAWGHQNLFVDDAEYDHWCSTIGSGSVQARLEFMAFAKLSQCAFVLVCGLLHPDPLQRYGILALLKHPYFMKQGVSEFHRLGQRAAFRLREPSIIPSVVPHAPIYAPRAADNTPHGWINPRGAFFF